MEASAKSVVALLRAAHLGPCLVVTALATALALAAGRGAGATWVAAAVLAGQLSVGWSNDWLDAHRDQAAGRTDKPIVTGVVPLVVVRRAAVAALVAAVPLSLASGLPATVVHLAAVALGWSYNLRLKHTMLSVVPYAAAFGLLPVFVAQGAGGRAPWWMITAAALLGAGAHFTNVLPDLAVDAATGVRGLPQRLGARGSVVTAALLLGGGAATVAIGRGDLGGPVATTAFVTAALLVAGVALVGWRVGTRLAFSMTMATAAAVLVVLLASGPVLG